MRVNVTLACTECGDRNYITTKKKKKTNARILNKKKFLRYKKKNLHLVN